MMKSYGLIVEGQFDAGVYEELIRKICPEVNDIRVRIAGDRAQIMKKFASLLRTMEHITAQGGPVDKALVIRDADCLDAAKIEAEMHKSASRQGFAFPEGIGFHAVKQEMETWLLADPNAINRVAALRSGRPVPRVPDPLECIQDAKEKLMATLSRSGLNYTSAVCNEIARETDLAILRIRCPSFQVFEQKVTDP
jgi:hypothetical protein